MPIIKNKFYFLGLAVVLVLISTFAFIKLEKKLSIEFTGGTVVTASYTTSTKGVIESPTQEQIRLALKALDIPAYEILQLGDNEYRIKFKEFEETKRPELKKALSIDGDYNYDETGFERVGPSLGNELAKKALIAISLACLLVILFVAYSFREVSKPIPSYAYGIIVVITLLHDIIVATGAYTYMGVAYGAEMDSLFIIALLTIMGISISDTIVVFDRIRENQKVMRGQSFANIVGESLSQTFVRSVNTSVTVLLALFALFFVGPEATKFFSLILIIGLIVGTYSSIFLASPLLVLSEKLFVKDNKGKK